ncbi:cobalt-precorrin-2 C(20)-methyltransferase [Halovivax asiaticus JCM 14624]|uniref:Cobalt-precorrin-2 C(20)-methyltransferase n=1 Tax=Halovivax asiaticus JCM 14624 TaxID=1227490 RepID=M0BMH6_9EURY|nr:cobalt-factor II C(20)-methyltransferase [Halovivax asiaticus]ELZ11692.1 cobalt-precorrin-2 C(20)-methyltransferase [Halovivax asiaticus JCM 14624]
MTPAISGSEPATGSDPDTPTVYGVGLGPGDADLVTVRGRAVLESVETVYSPGRLSRSVATEYVDEATIGDLEFPMTRDPDRLRAAWTEAAEVVAARAREADVAFVTLGDPNVYSTFGHLRRTLEAFHPDVALDVVPGVSAMTAFATALGVEIAAGTGLALREAADGAAPTGPDRLILFKVTDAPTTHEKLTDAGYEVRFGRRLFMEHGETIVTDDPADLAERDYYTLAYAEKESFEVEQATAAFLTDGESDGASTESGGDDGSATSGEPIADGGDELVALERADGRGGGDCGGHR